MEAFGSIPVYRAHESGARGGDASRNDASFARCRAELAAGGALALFPEGVSHSDPQLRPLKTGAARIALSAEAEHDGKIDVMLVPVGLYYERKELFRSSVLLVVGEPIAVAPLLDDYRRDERQAVTRLTETIDARLDEVVLQAESRDLLAGIARVARWTREEDADGDLAAQHQRARELADAYAPAARARSRARRSDRRRGPRLRARVAAARHPRSVGARARAVASRRAGRRAAKLIVAAPLAAVGALLGWIPYRLAGEVAKRITQDEDVLGTAKLLAGAVFLALAWGAEAVAAGIAWGAGWVAPVFVGAVATGYVALRFEELRRRGRGGLASGGAARVPPPDHAATRRTPPRARRRGRERPARR